MVGTTGITAVDGTPLAGPMPNYKVVRNFLDEEMVARLLDYAVLHEAEFQATTRGDGSLDLAYRVSARLSDFGVLQREVRNKVWALTPVLSDALKVSAFEPSTIEVELIAHGDGAFLKRHLDVSTGPELEKRTTRRLMSGVYYFHSRPKRFSGGALRLYAFGANEASGTFVDLEPEWNALVVFPPWAPHEVLPVSCPSKRLVDSRFAINCGFRGFKPGLRNGQATVDGVAS